MRPATTPQQQRRSRRPRCRFADGCGGSAAGASRRRRERHLRRRRVALRREELLVAEPERPRDERPGNALDRGVEVHDGRVVVAAGGADLVLGVGEVLLQPKEVLGRLEVGIGLGDGEEAAERARSGTSFALAGRAGRAGALERRPRLRHLLEDTRARAPRSRGPPRRGSGSGRRAAGAGRRCSTSPCRPRCAAERAGCSRGREHDHEPRRRRGGSRARACCGRV